MKLVSLFILLGCITSLVTGCGGSGGGGSSAPKGSDLFKKDMAWLASSPMMSAKAVDGQMNGAITKAFGGTTMTDVNQFIADRVKYVYNLSEAVNFKVHFYDNGSLLGTATVRDIFGEVPDPNKDFTAAMNAGAGLAMAEYQSGYDLKIQLPEGRMDAGSFRLGLVFLTRHYSSQLGYGGKQYPRPAEGRISILVHEGRHSDCPNGQGQADCGFGHRECTSGNMIGLPACDNSFWGPYAMGALYLRSTQDNYPSDSQEYRIIELMADDSLSRLDSAQKNALYDSDPELGSF